MPTGIIKYALAIAELKKAKAHSDAGRYTDKAMILETDMLKNPMQWIVDSKKDQTYPGITHVPTGFRYHLPRNRIPQNVMAKAAAAKVKADDCMVVKAAMEKAARKAMPDFLDQDRPESVKAIYRALKRDHPDMPAEMKARIASRQGKPGHQKQGPPYKAPIK